MDSRIDKEIQLWSQKTGLSFMVIAGGPEPRQKDAKHIIVQYVLYIFPLTRTNGCPKSTCSYHSSRTETTPRRNFQEFAPDISAKLGSAYFKFLEQVFRESSSSDYLAVTHIFE